MKTSFYNDTALRKTLMAKLGTLSVLSTVFLLTISCASIPREVSLARLFDHFEKAPHVLARAKSTFLRDMAASFDDSTLESIMTALSATKNGAHGPVDRNRLDKTLTRADALGVGISWNGTQNPAVEMVFAGNFPSLLTSLSFSFDSNWERIAGGYAAKNGRLYLREPSDGQLHFTTWAAQNPPPTSDAAASMARRSGMVGSNADMVVYLDAQSTLVSQLPILEGVTFPFDGILLSATRDALSPAKGSPDARYSIVFQIQMKDEQTARTYKPIMKFMWVLVSSRLSAAGIPISPDNIIEQHGALFLSQPVAMSAQQIVDAVLGLVSNRGSSGPLQGGQSSR